MSKELEEAMNAVSELGEVKCENCSHCFWAGCIAGSMISIIVLVIELVRWLI